MLGLDRLFRRKSARLTGKGGGDGDDTPVRRRVAAPFTHLCGITDIGRLRDHNEDTFRISPDGRIMIVADGMGGHQSGEVASALAAGVLLDFVESARAAPSGLSGAGIQPVLTEAFEAAHQRVHEAGAGQQDHQRMGAALILAYLDADRLITCHVGDVRCYLRNPAGLQQLTQDHSVVASLVRAGELTPAEARAHPQKNEILQAVGLPMAPVPEFHSVDLTPGDRVLLCSDGFWESLEESEIGTILDRGSVEDCSRTLVNWANHAGGHDNITVVLYEHPRLPDDHPGPPGRPRPGPAGA